MDLAITVPLLSVIKKQHKTDTTRIARSRQEKASPEPGRSSFGDSNQHDDAT